MLSPVKKNKKTELMGVKPSPLIAKFNNTDYYYSNMQWGNALLMGIHNMFLWRNKKN